MFQRCKQVADNWAVPTFMDVNELVSLPKEQFELCNLARGRCESLLRCN